MMQRREWTADMDLALARAWGSGESMCSMSKRTRIGRSSLYRRASELGFKTRQPQKRRKNGYIKLPTLPDSAHPLVKVLFSIMRREKISLSWLAKRVGLSREAIGSWRLHSSPHLVSIAACFTALGYELKVSKMKHT